MAPDRERASRAVLHADARRAETARGRNGGLEPARRRHRAPAESRDVTMGWRAFARGLRALVNPRTADADADDEIRHFLQESAADFEAGGLSPAEARREARARWGDAIVIREQVRGSG